MFSLMMWMPFALLAGSVTLMLTIICLEKMVILSAGTSEMVAGILASVWVPIGLISIISILLAILIANSIYDDPIPAPEDITPKQQNVTGTENGIDYFFMMDQHLSEMRILLKQLEDTRTAIQQQLLKDV
jgi:hypothetical protein